MPLPIHPAARGAPGTTFLVWHDIVPGKKQVWFDTSVAEFEGQLRRLERAGARPTALASVASWLATGKNPPPPGALVLCFDDNTEGIYRHAFPILKRRRWPFCVSVHTGYVGVTTGKAHSTWAMLQEMERGGASVISQTRTHPPDLRTLKGGPLAAELVRPRADLQAALGRDVRYLTYPAGKWDARVAAAAEKAGYLLALTEDRGYAELSPHRLAVNRFSSHRRFEEAVAAIARAARRAGRSAAPAR